MKPSVTRVSSVPMTSLVCCPGCYRLISFEASQASVSCHACGAVVRDPSLDGALNPSPRMD